MVENSEIDPSYYKDCDGNNCTEPLQYLTCGDLPSELPNDMNYPNAECVSGFMDCTGECFNSESFSFCINNGGTEDCFNSNLFTSQFIVSCCV